MIIHVKYIQLYASCLCDKLNSSLVATDNKPINPSLIAVRLNFIHYFKNSLHAPKKNEKISIIKLHIQTYLASFRPRRKKNLRITPNKRTQINFQSTHYSGSRENFSHTKEHGSEFLLIFVVDLVFIWFHIFTHLKVIQSQIILFP